MKSIQTMVLVGLLTVAGVASAQIQPPGPSGYVENIEERGSVGGEAGEVDAEQAQAERFEAGKPVPGVSPSRAAQVEEIVVQARKRAEFLEDTPVSVTALGENTLREAGVTRLDEIQQLVPNLSFQTGTSGLAVNIIIRGVGTPQSAAIAFDPGVGVYVDGVFLPRTIGPLIDVINLEQIEVLRGPQGTLFGKNTVGGAINITTVKPKDDYEGFVLLRPGNFGSLFTQGMVNVPIVEDYVFGRFAVSSNNNKGYSYNDYQDVHYNDRNSLTLLGTLRILPIDDVTIDVTGMWSHEHNASRSGQCVRAGNGGLGDLVPPVTIDGEELTFYEACERTSPYENSSNIHQLSDVKSYGTWGTINWDVGDLGPIEDFSVKSITSWREQRPRLRVDVDQTAGQAIYRSSVGGAPLDGLPGFQQQISTELQVNAAAWEDRIHFVGGYFVFWENGRDAQVLGVNPEVLGIETLNKREIDNWNWALYSQATADFTDWLSLTGGVRYTEEKKGVTASNTDVATGVTPDIPAESAIYTAWTPMGSLALFLPESALEVVRLDHLMGYFTYSRGFRGGGFNGVIDPQLTELGGFKPEYLNSYEVGFKTIAFDQRATFNVSLFYGDYTDIQVTTQREIESDTGVNIGQETTNAAQATQKGVEIETLLNLVEGLSITGSVGILHTNYDEFAAFSDLTGDPVSRAGESFNDAPELQTHIAIQYSFPVPLEGAMAGWITPRLDWYYQSSIHVLGPELPQAVQPGVNLLHARLSYSFMDDRAQVALWAQNLLNETYFDTVSPVASSFGYVTRYYQAPRTWGGELSYSF